MNLKMFFEPQSLLASMTMVSLISTIGAKGIVNALPSVAKPILSISQPILVICIVVWMGFIGLTFASRF